MYSLYEVQSLKLCKHVKGILRVYVNYIVCVYIYIYMSTSIYIYIYIWPKHAHIHVTRIYASCVDANMIL